MLIDSNIFKEYEVLANKVLTDKPNIVLYGGGNTANICIPIFKSLGLNIKTILDKSPVLIDTQHQGIPIIHPNKHQDIKDIIVICVSEHFRDIEAELKARGFYNILPHFFYLFNKPVDLCIDTIILKNYYNAKWEFSEPKYGVLDSIDIPITERCSLKCKDCSNLMQYFSKPKHANFTQMFAAIKKLLTAIEYCHEVRILGGEPFVNPEWHNYVKSLEKYADKFDLIVIYTNATILPNEKALQNLPVDRLFIKISDYGNSRQKIKESIDLFNKYKIPNYSTKVFQWQDCGILQKYNRSPKENIEILNECCVKNTPVITEGKLFRCPYAASAWLLKAIPAFQFPYVDLLNSELADSEIKRQVQNIMKMNDARICDWCGGRPITGSYIEPALQTDKVLEYKIYE